MLEISTSGLMSGDGKRSGLFRAQPPRPSSTLQDNGRPRAYAVFTKDGKVIDSRYAVQIDACNTQTYVAFDAIGPTKAGILGPLY
jgi:hypothetical protein